MVSQLLKKTLKSHQYQAQEKTSQKQSKSQACHTHCIDRITGTAFHHVCKASEDLPAKSSIGKIIIQCGDNRELNVPAVAWGREHEKTGGKMYTSALEKTHTNSSVSPSGLGQCKTTVFLVLWRMDFSAVHAVGMGSLKERAHKNITMA